MSTLATTRPVAAPRISSLGSRFLFWIEALEAGFGTAQARKSDDRLADMGLIRSDAEAEFARNGGKADLPLRALSGW
jgi:hypothetical protein